MVAWFLTAILTVGLFAYISMTGVDIVSNTQTASQRTESVRRLDAVVAALGSQSAAPFADGIVYAPAGGAKDGVYSLPDALGPIGLTPFGSRFVYCPMGRPVGNANGTVQYRGGSYGITTAGLNDVGYVVGGRPSIDAASDQNVIAFVIAPLAADAALPGCGDVVRNGDGYVAPNGIVRALRRTTIADVDVVREGAGATWYVSPSGGGDGRSPNNPTSLDAALSSYRSSPGRAFSIVMAGGTYSSSAALLDQNATTIPTRNASATLVLSSPTAAAIRIAGSIDLPGDLELRNVDLGTTPTVVGTGRRLLSTSSTLGPVVARPRSSVVFVGSNVVSATSSVAAAIDGSAGSSVSVTPGTLTIQYANGVPAWRVESGASANVNAATVNLSPVNSQAGSVQARLITTDPGSQISFRSSVVNYNGPSNYPVLIGGRMTAIGTTFAPNAQTYVGVQGTTGARLDMPGVTIRGSSPATYAISAVGTAGVTGFGNLYSQGRCWYQGEGSLFRLSNGGYAGESSATTADEQLPFMAASPSPAQATRFQAVVSRNTEKASMRASLNPGTTGFACQQSAPASYVRCAGEGQECQVPYFTRVRYGDGNTWTPLRYVGKEGVSCDNATFSDPLVGVLKQCQYLAQ